VAQADTLRSRPDLKLLFGFGETRREGGPYLRKIILANVRFWPKADILPQQRSFIGSLNRDPRVFSWHSRTEKGPVDKRSTQQCRGPPKP